MLRLTPMPPRDRPRLDRDRVLDTALALIDEEGLHRLTLRGLAKRLGVSPMGVYWHFENKADIVAQLVDHAVGGYDVVPPRSDAGPPDRENDLARLIRAFSEMYRGLDEHPGLLPLLSDPASIGPASRAVREALIGIFAALGLPRPGAERAYHHVMSYTIGALVMAHASGDAGRGRSEFSAGLGDVVEMALGS